ncbi:MAG TPA: hypothetical protein VKV96_20500 [Roseiarcus sp.]|nr:hypothetical protein [Roseiarcus sp.]
MSIKSWHGPQLEAVFALIEEAAAKGARCPTRDEIRAHLVAAGHGGEPVRLTRELCRSGRIMIYVHAKNWRVAKIMAGPHAGKTTMPPPRPWAAYLRIGETTERLSA